MCSAPVRQARVPIEQTATLTSADLRSVFSKAEDAKEAIGIEVESAVLDPLTGQSTPYEGDDGIRAILERLLAELGGNPVVAGGNLVGLAHDSGMQLTLEHGGAIEYASAPHSDIVGLVEGTRNVLQQVAEIVGGFGRVLLPGANYPFTSDDAIQWMPKPQARLMRDHFASLGDSGSLGPTVMASTLSTQVTLDYLSEGDLCEKLAMQVAVSPVAAAIFANSPLGSGQLTGLLSYRTHCWQKCDPPRCGVLTVALEEDAGVDTFIDWALGLRMIYRKRAGGYERGPDRAFGELLRSGFDDGTFPDREDWISTLSQVWTDVRLRSTLELRAADGPAFRDLASVPAFWVGLSYHAPSRATARELLRDVTAADFQGAMPDIAANGLAATVGRESLPDIARELVALATAGLQARVDGGLESSTALTYLEPIREVVETGRTFAERCIERWDGDLGRSPERYLEAYRVR